MRYRKSAFVIVLWGTVTIKTAAQVYCLSRRTLTGELIPSTSIFPSLIIAFGQYAYLYSSCFRIELPVISTRV